jgi:NAD(P)-dependent dehydrogenase (short-subunit alcohol dehydrogenase family)
MSMFDLFRYDGKRCVVVGAATGMGNATARLLVDAGAEVVAMDYAPMDIAGVASTISVNLADRGSIDAAVDECGGRVDALFSCAGVADGTPGIEKINFLGHRHMIDRMLEAGMLARGSAIGFISSAAGAGWARDDNMEILGEYLDIEDMDEASQWALDNGKADYFQSKLAVCLYVARSAYPLLKQGIRINAIMPGPTDTPLARANADMWLGFAADFRAELDLEPSTPLEQAYPLVFLCSDAAVGVNGITVVTDAGYGSAGATGAFEPATGVVEFMTQLHLE